MEWNKHHHFKFLLDLDDELFFIVFPLFARMICNVQGARLPWMVAEGDDEPNIGEDIRT